MNLPLSTTRRSKGILFVWFISKSSIDLSNSSFRLEVLQCLGPFRGSISYTRLKNSNGNAPNVIIILGLCSRTSCLNNSISAFTSAPHQFNVLGTISVSLTTLLMKISVYLFVHVVPYILDPVSQLKLESKCSSEQQDVLD